MEPLQSVSLKEHIESRLSALEKAISEAKHDLEKRLEGMNEFRAQLKDQAYSFITRNEYALCIERINSEINSLKEFKAALDGKASQRSTIISIVISVISLIIGIIAIIIKIN
jgi:hypothetical protein